MTGKTPLHDLFVSNLRRVMFDQHLTQQALASKARMQRSAVSMILSGTDLRLSTLDRMATALGVEPWTLLAVPPVVERTNGQHHKSIVEAIALLLDKTRAS